MVEKVLLSEIIWRLQVQSQLLVNNKEYLLELNICTRSWLTELEQSTHCGLNKGFSLKFCVGSRALHEPPENSQKMHWPKHCEYSNEDEDNGPKL